MYKRFVVGDAVYVVSYSNHEFEFYIDTSKSSKNYQSDTEKAFGDKPPDQVMFITESSNVYEVFSNIKSFVDGVLKGEKPYFFKYYANQPQKYKAYSSFASRICKLYGYTYTFDNGSYMFYKSVVSEEA